MRPLTIVVAFAAGLIAGAVLMSTVRAAAPRPAHVIPAVGWGFDEPDRGRTAAPNPGLVVMTPQPTTGTQPALEGTPATAIPSPGHTPQSPTPAVEPSSSPRTPRSGTRVPDRAPRAVVTGSASWFDAPAGTAAAGPALRAALGRYWRGRKVSVCTTGGNCVSVTLTDTCQCFRGTSRERVIDLSATSFSRLAPLDRGIVRVVVSW